MYFSKSIYIEALKKVKAVGIGMAVTVMILNVLSIIHYFNFNYTTLYNENITGGEIAPATSIVMIFSFFLVTSAFSFLNSRCGSDFYHSIPTSRICLYNSFISAIGSWIAAVTFGSVMINWLLLTLSSSTSVKITDAFLVAFGYFISSMVIAGIVTFCRMLAGTTTATVFYSACMMIVPRVSAFLFIEILELLNPSIYLPKTIFKFISLGYSCFFPIGETFNTSMDNFANIPLLLFLLVEALALFGIGAYFYVRRKSEVSGKTPASKKIQNVFRAFVSFPFIVYAIYLMMDSVYISISFITIASLALLLHFLFELCTTKSVKNAFKALPLLLISVALAAGFVFASHITASGFRSSNPTADTLESFSITSNSDYKYSRYMNINADTEEAKELVLKQLEFSSHHHDRVYGQNMFIKFKMKDGSEKYRELYFPHTYEGDAARTALLEQIEKCSDYSRHSVKIPENAELTNITFYSSTISSSVAFSTYVSDSKEIVEAFKAEYLSLTDFDKKKVEAFSESSKQGNAKLEFHWDQTVYEYNLSYELTPKTLALVFAHADGSSKLYSSQLIEYLDMAFDRNDAIQIIKLSDPSVQFTVRMKELFETNIPDEEFEETSESPQEIKTFLDFKKSIVWGEIADYSNLKKVYSVCFPYGNTKTDFYFFSLTDVQIEFLLENRLKFT